MKIIEYSVKKNEDNSIDINIGIKHKCLYLIIFFLIAYAFFIVLLIKLFL